MGEKRNVNKMNHEQVLEMINKRIDDLAESYKILNDSHNKLENSFTEMRTEYQTTKSWIKQPLKQPCAI